MLRYLSIVLILLFSPSLGGGWGEASAQPEQPAPKWVAKTAKAVVSVLTYDQKNELLHSGTGAFVSADGVCVAAYSLFRDAYSAAVVDQDGKKYDVERILGADDTYGVVRFRVAAKKVNFLPVALSTASHEGQTVYAQMFSKAKLVSMPQSAIEKKDIVEDSYAYLTLSRMFDEKYTGAMLFTDAGDFIGIVQSPIGGKSYATDSRYAASLQMEAIPKRIAASALNNIHLRKGLPESQEEALVYLYFKSRSAGNDEYLDLLNLFLTTWPDCAEGYQRRAMPLMDLQRFAEADRDLATYLRLASDKTVAEANVAQAIATKLTYQKEVPYEEWTYDVALAHMDRALAGAERNVQQAASDSLRSAAESQLLGYQLQKAQILLAKPDPQAALSIYDALADGPHRSPAILYAASLAHAQMGDSVSVQIALLDSALAMFPDPLPEEAANYVMLRAKLKASVGRFREAVLDYNQYCYLKNNRVNDVFHYERAQVEIQGRMFQQALDDLDQAIGQAPREPLYLVEKSALLLRVNEIGQCIDYARQALALNPSLSDAYRILGFALIQKGDKEAGRRQLERAIELGDESAQEIIDKYAK